MSACDAEIALYIYEHEGVDLEGLATRFNIAERTARAKVQRANAMLDGTARITYRRSQGGYILQVFDCDSFERWRHVHVDSASRLPATHNERVAFILNDLLSRTDYITLDDLAETLFVSRASISHDLKDVEARIGRYNLTLERRPYHGMRIMGSEMDRRMCMADAAVASEGNTLPNAVQALLPHAGDNASAATRQMLINTVASCVQEVTASVGFAINAVAYQGLLVHIVISLIRVKSGCYVPIASESLERVRETRAFAVAQRVVSCIEQKLNLSLPEEEVAYIAIHLAGKETIYASEADEKDFDSTGVIISDEVWAIVSEMLERVWRAFRFDFRNDLELRMNLAQHIVPLTVRLQYHMNLKNPLLSDIKTRYPLAYSMAIGASAVISECYELGLSEDETGYIALSFALALERQKTAPPKKNIMVVCASGAGSARLLEHRCRQEFDDCVGNIVMCDVLRIEDVNFDDIDYVFTTVPLPKALPVPVREVTRFFDAAEIEGVRGLLRAQAASDELVRYVSQDLFFPHCPYSEKNELISFLCERMSAIRQVDRGFTDLVFERERASGTAFGNNVAMPHPIEGAADETFMAVAVLDRPLVWDDGGQTVQAVFLIAYSRSGGAELDAFFSALADVLVDKEAISSLVNRQTWQELNRILSLSI